MYIYIYIYNYIYNCIYIYIYIYIYNYIYNCIYIYNYIYIILYLIVYIIVYICNNTYYIYTQFKANIYIIYKNIYIYIYYTYIYSRVPKVGHCFRFPTSTAGSRRVKEGGPLLGWFQSYALGVNFGRARFFAFLL